MILQTVKAVAIEFQIANNLDRHEIPSLLRHDYIHSVLGLGVSTVEEELVEVIELHLERGAMWNVEAVELARSLPSEFLALYKFGNI